MIVTVAFQTCTCRPCYSTLRTQPIRSRLRLIKVFCLIAPGATPHTGNCHSGVRAAGFVVWNRRRGMESTLPCSRLQMIPNMAGDKFQSPPPFFLFPSCFVAVRSHSQYDPIFIKLRRHRLICIVPCPRFAAKSLEHTRHNY